MIREVLPHGPPDGEFDVGGGVAGMQVLIREWACLMNRAAGHRNPIEERTG